MSQTFYYELSYAGIPFVLDEGVSVGVSYPESVHTFEKDRTIRQFQAKADLLDELNRLVPFRYGKEFFYPTSFQGKNLTALGIGGSDWTPDINIGEFFYPNTASRWGVFRGLATSAQVSLMQDACTGTTGSSIVPATFRIIAPPVNGLNSGGSYTDYQVTTQLYMLPPKPLAEHGGQYDGLFLVTLVDERFYFRGTPVRLHCNSSTTWLDLLTELRDALGITITNLATFSSEEVYGQPEADSQLWTNFEIASLLLDVVAANLGRVVVRNLSGSYSLLTPLESRNRAILNRGNCANILQNAGGDYFVSGTNLPSSPRLSFKNAVIPATVHVTFPMYIEGDDPVPHFFNPRYPNQRPSAWHEDSYGDTYRVEVPIASGCPLLSGVIEVDSLVEITAALNSGFAGLSDLTLHNTAKALYSGEAQAGASADPNNVSGLRALAMQLAQNHYHWQIGMALDESYPGTYEWDPEGYHDIVWTYSARARQAATRVVKSPWTQVVTDFQHSTPIVSGHTNTPIGVGGPSVAQTIRDSYGAAGTFSGISGTDQRIQTKLAADFISGSTSLTVEDVSHFPTQNRWRAELYNSGYEGVFSPYRELILCEGTSGGIGARGSFTINVVYRSIDGTVTPGSGFLSGDLLRQVMPDTTYGVNLTTYEKGQFNFPHEWTSGGIQGNRVIPQVQTVTVHCASGENINERLHYSGSVTVYDGAHPEPFIRVEPIWVVYRNDPVVPSSGLLFSGPLSGGPCGTFSGTSYSGMSFSGQIFSGIPNSGIPYIPMRSGRYLGQLVGFSATTSGGMPAAPVYAIDNETGFWARLRDKEFPVGEYVRYKWEPVIDTTKYDHISWKDQLEFCEPPEIPAYEVNDVDLPTILSGPDPDAWRASGGQPPIVWMRPGQGNYMLFEQPPRWEDVEKVGSGIIISGVLYYQGILVRYDQDSKLFCHRRNVLLRLATDTVAEECI